MKRKALIIYCDDTREDYLTGSSSNYRNYRTFLQSSLGGQWKSKEIYTLHNPTYIDIRLKMELFMRGADYTFIVFSGYKYTKMPEREQYLKINSTDIKLKRLKTNAPRQTLILDSCEDFEATTEDHSTKIHSYIDFDRDFEATAEEQPVEFRVYKDLDKNSARDIFDKAVLSADKGWAILDAGTESQLDFGVSLSGAYLHSLLKISEKWKAANRGGSVLRLNMAHEKAADYLRANISANQAPLINAGDERRQYPFAVKTAPVEN